MPVHYLPEGVKVVGTAVLIVEVVGMFPHIEGEQGDEAAAHRVAGVGLLSDDQVAVGIE